MLQETEHWRLEIVPRYVRKPYEKKFSEVRCNCVDPESMSFHAGNDPNCIHCHGTGSFFREIRETVPEPPAIDMAYIEHMRKAHKEFFGA